MSTARAFSLSTGRHALLNALWENRETEEGELTCSIPGGWWLGNTRDPLHMASGVTILIGLYVTYYGIWRGRASRPH